MGAGGRMVSIQLTRRESIREKDHDMANHVRLSIRFKANAPCSILEMNKETFVWDFRMGYGLYHGTI